MDKDIRNLVLLQPIQLQFDEVRVAGRFRRTTPEPERALPVVGG